MKDYQQALFPYAYNILGSAEDARDAIQDVMVKYMASPKQELDNEMGYLVRSVINQSINIKKRKQRSAGDPLWLPEPVATEQADVNVNRDEIISYSMLVLLEHLNPKERAAFILKEAFDYSHEDIARALSITVDSSRKLLSRARQKLGDVKAEREEILLPPAYLNNYISVIRNGDLQSLEKMLSDEVAFSTDGGGRIKIVSEFTTGISATMDLILYVYNTYQQSLTITPARINHQQALLFHQGDHLISCQVFELDKNNTQIRHIYSIVDPEKLKNIGITRF